MTAPDLTPSVLAKYRKAVLVVIVTVLTFVSSVLTGGISAKEWVMIIGVAVAAIATAIVPELDSGIGSIAKTAATFLLAGLAVLTNVIQGGLDGGELVEVIVAALAAIGVTAIPNDWPPAVQPLAGSTTARYSTD